MDASSSSSAASTSASSQSHQAGPLPSKRGEIGWEESAEVRAEEGRSTSPLPERHPEDRAATEVAADSTPATPPAIPAASVSTSSLPNSTAKTKRILGIFKPKKIPVYAGLRLTTLVAFAGTIVGWYFAITRIGHSSSSDSQQGSSDNNNANSNQVLGSASSSIFIHVVFGVATIVQLLFIERRVFRLRAQRYSYVHPGEILPSARLRQLGGSNPALALSPWNRPPLPTYAAALAQSGAGTGDAEDHLIAAPPPPAYGNTRGSTFLLSGFLRESLRAQRPPSRTSRPLSYKTADRARRLEETLARLEAPAPAVTR
ncbi:hypothetical protein C8F01DRAFT_1218217 [Mycena amicta]|nr:hypothetical protein C8F01DRAFT_1218217 [Mycena amicta]